MERHRRVVEALFGELFRIFRAPDFRRRKSSKALSRPPETSRGLPEPFWDSFEKNENTIITKEVIKTIHLKKIENASTAYVPAKLIPCGELHKNIAVTKNPINET